jgi:hypothetical protein
VDVRAEPAALPACAMLTHLPGDVLPVACGGFMPREIEKQEMDRVTLLGMRVHVVLPIVMVFVALVLRRPQRRCANILSFVVFSAMGAAELPIHPSAYGRSHIDVSLVIN